MYKNPKFPKLTAGTGISDFLRTIVGDIVTYQDRLAVASDRILSLATLPEFAPYHRILSDFGYRDILGLMLIHVYPFDRFLVNGKPYRQRRSVIQGINLDRQCRKNSRQPGLMDG